MCDSRKLNNGTKVADLKVCETDKLMQVVLYFLFDLRRPEINTVYSCKWPVIPGQDVIGMSVPNPFLFNYFVWDCNFLFTPTFWRTHLGRETRATCTEIRCDFFRAEFLPSDRRQYCGSLLWNCRGSRPVICVSGGRAFSLSFSRSLCYGSPCLTQVKFSRVRFSASPSSF